MRKRTTNTGMWLPSATSPLHSFPGNSLNSSSGTPFLSHWAFCESPQGMFRPWASSGFTLVWISVISITGEPQLSHGCSGFPSWAAVLGCQGCVVYLGKGICSLWNCCCSFVSIQVPGVAGVHSGRCCVNTKDYFPSLSLLPSREASVSAWAYCKKIQVLFLLICSAFPGLFQHYPEAVLKLFNAP